MMIRELPSDSHFSGYSRREFLAGVGLLAAAAASGCSSFSLAGREPIIDIHQHVGYSGRPDENLIAHQEAMGITHTILLPSGTPMRTPATDFGKANGLQADCYGNSACYRFARANPRRFSFAANEVPDYPLAVAEIEKYLKLGAVAIAEQKFCVECDCPQMERLYELAADHSVPILMHWQYGTYNHGFDRFGKVLQRFPRTTFVGHAQTWWANIDGRHADQSVLYPKGKVFPGGMTDRYLSDYSNVYADLSAGSGLNALTRDEDFTIGFFQRQQDKLLFGSDCNDRAGSGPQCQGSQTINVVRRLTSQKAIERKILYENAKRIFHL